MTLQEQIKSDLVSAMKAGETLTRDTLRLVDSAIKNEMIEKGVRDDGLDDDAVIAVIKRLVKQRKDSVTQYRDGGRDDLADKEQEEISILQKYLPEQMDEAAVSEAVQKVITELGVSSTADMGKVMGVAMKVLGDQADGTMVKKAVDKLLEV